MIVVLSWANNEATTHDGAAYRIKQDRETGWWYAFSVEGSKPPRRLATPGGYRGTEQEAKSVAQTDAERTIEREQNEDSRHRTARG